MTFAWSLYARLILRPLLREPVRTALTIFAVALGVGLVVAIDLAGQAAAGSFHSSVESLTGKSDLLISATGGLDERILARLVELPYPLRFSPRIEDFASINGKGEALPFIGLDLVGYAEDQTRNSGDFDLMERQISNPIWVGDALGLHRGQQVQLLINDVMRPFTVAGVIKKRAGEIGENRAIVADIGLAQIVTGKVGKLDSIDVHVPDSHSLEEWTGILRRELPVSCSIEPQGSRTEENRKMLSAFRWNLRVLSYIALIVGGFLIYNTISISVVRRRNEIGVLRALGATRALVTGGFLLEALFFAVVGSLLGLLLGRFMAIGAVALIGNTIQALYVSSVPAPITLTFETALTGAALGLAVSLLAALAPAFEAAAVTPIEAMARGREQYTVQVRSGRLAMWALAMLVLAAICARLPAIDRQPLFAYAAVLLLIAGTATLIPYLVKLFESVAGATTEKLLGIEALLALRSLRASVQRTSVLTAALATAVAMTASVGIMVGSFRQTVSVWMKNQLTADFYLRPAGAAAADRHPTIDAQIADRIEQLPGVAAVDRFRAYPISYEGLPATLAGGESSRIRNSAATLFLPGEDRNAILSKLPTGDYAVVSEPFANKHNIRPGSTLALPINGALRQFRVLGIYYDYSTERGFVVLDRRTLLKYLPDPAVSNIAVYLKPGTQPEAVRDSIDAVVAGHAVVIFSNRALRKGAIEVFDRTFRITYALELVAIVVAVMGIAGALLAMVIDRRREFGLLRFLGGAQPQITRIILCEAGLLGLLANGIGLVLGTLLSLILIFVINKQSFGWTFQFHWPVTLLLAALTGVYAATVLAALYPARIATHMNPIEVIHQE